MQFVVYLFIVGICSVLNRLRGGGLGAYRLPAVTDIWIAPIFGILAAYIGIVPLSYIIDIFSIVTTSDIIISTFTATLFSLGWLAWSTPAWGYLFGLWYETPAASRQPSWYENLMLKISGGNRTVAFGIRMTAFLIPLSLVFGWYWMALGPLLLCSYILGWEISKRNIQNYGGEYYPAYGIPLSEYIAGAVWGVFIIVVSILIGYGNNN